MMKILIFFSYSPGFFVDKFVEDAIAISKLNCTTGKARAWHIWKFFLSQILFWIYFFLNYNQNIQTGYEILTTTRFVFVSITTKKLLFLFFCQGFWLNKACISLNIVQEVGKEITCAQAHIETSYSQQSQFWITQPYYGMTSSPIAFRSYFYCRKAVITFQLKLCLLV